MTAENSSPVYLSCSAATSFFCSGSTSSDGRRLHREPVDAVDAEQPLRRGDRDVHLGVAVDAERRADLREDADDAEPDARDGHLPAERVDVAEEVLRDRGTEHGDPASRVDVGRRDVVTARQRPGRRRWARSR